MSLKKVTASLLMLGGGMLLTTTGDAATKHHRVVWDSDPAHKAIIAFSPDGSSDSPYVKYGYSTDESQWTTKTPDATRTFDSSLTSHFVRLTGLTANSAVYYRVCDQDGCGQPFWFRTAPTDDSPYTVVAGGDTRTGWTTRRQGNALVAKIRPLFIMHGGDFTNSNDAYEMNEYLSDWALTYSDDTIDDIAYKRIYPFIPTHGNHEDNDYSTLCKVFGVDFNADGNCDPSDTYGAFNISPLLRVYTLNTQFKDSGWSTKAAEMNNWLSSDLTNNASSATWRFAQYHKPMFPHYTGKSENQILFDWWADEFYNNAMNLVVESDTHINKLTESLEPSGSDFVATTNGGTVYVGEGSWGAPSRSANDPKSWTIDLASIQQFKVLTVTSSQVDVRTAQFDSSADSLTKADRDQDPTVLPANVNWWIANEIGEVMNLVQNADNRTVINNTPNTDPELSIAATDDTFISSSQNSTNFNGSNEGLLADGSDSTYGEMHTLIKFDIDSVPDCYIATAATIQLEVFNPSSGSYNLYNGVNSWTESNATWDSVSGLAQQGSQIGSFNPGSTGSHEVTLSQQGLDVVNGWLQGNPNNGIIISSGGTSDGIDMNSKEQGSGPVLNINYQEDSDCSPQDPPPSDDTQLSNGVAVSISGAQGSETHFTFDVPSSATGVDITMSGGSGDADLYVKFGSQPTQSDYDCRPYKSGNEESCTFTAQTGTYYVMVHGYDSYSDASLVASYSESTSDPGGSLHETNLSGAQGSWQHFTIDVASGISSLDVVMGGGSGDADLYVKFGSQPTSSDYDCRPYKWGNDESCSFNNPAEGTWYISLYGYESYSGVDLQADWQ